MAFCIWGMYFLYYIRVATDEFAEVPVDMRELRFNKKLFSRETYYGYYKRILAAYQRQDLCNRK